MVRLRSDVPTVVEMALAFAVGAAWYAVVAVLFARPLPETLLVTCGMVVLAVGAVLATARWWDIPYAVTVGVASVVALDWYFIPPTHSVAVPDARNGVALVGYLLMAALLGELAVRARRRAIETEDARRALAGEQAALRRVATLVARQPAPEQVFAAVTEEVGRHLEADLATLIRYDVTADASVVATWSATGKPVPVGTSVSLDGDHLTAQVLRSARSARLDNLDTTSGAWVETLRNLGVRASAGCPVIVDGIVWGVMVVASRSARRFPEGTERRLGEFTELVATAIANAQARADLVASRARIVAAADEARRRIERDLHDGVQQRLVGLALNLRLVRGATGQVENMDPGLADIEAGLLSAVDELRDVAHGIHPAVLTDGGLRPALGALARRSPVPVELDAADVGRLPGHLEVGLYYVVAEALTNVAKHAAASLVRVSVRAVQSEVTVSVQDDGVGGADRGAGSGLLGLEDRVHALGGRLEITSTAGEGTTLRAIVPVPSTEDASPVARESSADRIA